MCASKRVRWSVAAGVAAAVVLAIGFWPGKGGRGAGSAFAAAVGQFQKASTLVCQFSSPTPISLMGMSIVPSGKLYISAEHGTRFENYGNGVLVNVMIVPPEGPAVSITPPGRQYMVLTGVNPSGRSSQNGPDAFIRGLSKLSGQPDRELGKAVVGGVEAYGYEISAASLGFAGEPGAHSELWVDAQTDMPVRYVVEMPGFEEGKITTYIFDQFEWNTPLDVELFDTAMPAGYTRVDTQMPAHDEATLIKGLGLYARQTGQYPSELSMARVVGGLIASGGANGAQPLTHQESLEVGAGVVFYMELAAGGRSPEYFGKTVLPGQKDAVLVRWKTEDGQWRVVYGDLRAETIGSQPQ
jgi:hypothetical protein